MISIDNKAKSNIIYILSYILPMIFYPVILITIFGLNFQISKIIDPSGSQDNIFMVFIVAEMSAAVSSINYIAYLINTKYLEEQENKKIFKKIVIVNTTIIALMALIFTVRTQW